MKKIMMLLLLLAVVSVSVFTTGCSTMQSKANYDVFIDSKPQGALCTIRDSSGKKLRQGETPFQVTLRAGGPYFYRYTYSLAFEKDGHKAQTIFLKGTLDSTYGNNLVMLLVAWPLTPIGMLIVDPLTGAMWELKTNVLTTLKKNKKDIQISEVIPVDKKKEIVLLKKELEKLNSEQRGEKL